VRSRLVALLCLTVGTSTFSIGSFPALLPDLDRVVGLSNVELGAVMSAFGFARMLSDIPIGLVVSRHLRWALLATPVVLAAGVLTIASGGPFGALLLGRVLMGFAHALGMVAALTTILRHQHGALGASLNAFEFSAMIGMLGGVALLGVLPKGLAWHHAYALTCAPLVVGFVTAPLVVASLPRVPATAVVEAPATASVTVPRTARGTSGTVALAFVTGSVIAITYATLDQFLIPLRGSREFGLDRVGVARILMIAQLADITALLPAGFLADRLGPTRVLGVVLLSLAGAALCISFGGVGWLVLGASLYGLGMAGWMLPLALVRRHTPISAIAWRTAVYRVGVDGGLFVGPFLSGLLGQRAWTLACACSAGLAALAVAHLTRDRDRR
jgi:MFS transporter, ACS family, D-galactonate transporter